MWKNHWLTITIAILDFIIILYSLIGIMNVGFEKAVGLFVIGIFIWFCLVYMVIRDNWGEVIHTLMIAPVRDIVNSNWEHLKWYASVICSCFSTSTPVICLYCKCKGYYMVVKLS